MKTEVYINPAYYNLEDFIIQIPEKFEQIGNVIHTGRNEVREVNVDGVRVVIKSFKRITVANRLIFATVRKSKGRRAYEHSNRLINEGITSPEPIAYLNCYRKGLLRENYYVCLYTNYLPIDNIFSLSLSESENALKAFARFTYRLHLLGIYHDDYTLSNVLYSFDGTNYDFSIIDNNRMRFRRYSFLKGLRSLQRIKLPLEKLAVIGAEYAKQANANDLKTMNVMIIFRFQYMHWLFLKKQFKALVKHQPKGMAQPTHSI